MKKLKEVRDHTKEVQPGQQRTNSTAPHRVARAQQEREHASSMPSMGSSAVGGLEAQIGGLSMQYHNLLLLLAGATGRRAAMLQAQIVALQQKLTELNLELRRESSKKQNTKTPSLKFRRTNKNACLGVRRSLQQCRDNKRVIHYSHQSFKQTF